MRETVLKIKGEGLSRHIVPPLSESLAEFSILFNLAAQLSLEELLG